MESGHFLNVIAIAVSIVIPIFLLPFMMRFITGPIVLRIVKRRYLPKYIRKLQSGWERPEDVRAFRTVVNLAMKRLRYHFVLVYNIKDDISAILDSMQRIYKPGKGGELIYGFSTKKLIECFLLAFSDLYTEYRDQRWFRLLGGIRIIWILRIINVKKAYRHFFRIRILALMRRTRLLGKITGIILIPVLGVPILLWYTVRSIIVSTFFEGYIRFLYGIIILKVGYYTVYLYSKSNSDISRRISEIPKGRLGKIAEQIDLMLIPGKRQKYSPAYKKALSAYLRILKDYNLPSDEMITLKEMPLKGKLIKFFSSLLSTVKRALLKYNPVHERESIDKSHFIRMYNEIGRVYYPLTEYPVYCLRFRELLELGYMASIIVFNKSLKAPLVNRVPISLIIKIKALYEFDLVKAATKGIKTASRFYPLVKVIRKSLKIIRGKTSPYSMAITFANDIFFQKFQDILREFAYHRAGRLLLFGFETNMLKRKIGLVPFLW